MTARGATRSRGRGPRALVLALLAATAPAAARDGDAVGVGLSWRWLQGSPSAVASDGTVAVVGLDTGLALLDVTDAANMQELGSVYLKSRVHDLAWVGNLVYAACGESGLQVVDVSLPGAPVVVGELVTGDVRGVALAGTTAYLADASVASPSLRVVDVSTPALPVELGAAPLGNGALCVAVSAAGTTAFVGVGADAAAPTQGLAVVNVATPGSPAQVGFLPTSGRPVHDVALQGATAWLATGVTFSGALVTADVTMPASPALLASRPLTDAGLAIHLDGGLAFVAASAQGLVRYDASDATDPRRTDVTPLGRSAVAVHSTDGTALVAVRGTSGRDGLAAIDSPAPPALPATTSMLPYGQASGVASDGRHLYLLDANGLVIAEADGTRTILGRFDSPGEPLRGIAALDTLVAVGAGAQVLLVDTWDPALPAQVGVAPLAEGVVVDMVLAGSALLVANGRTVEIFDVSNPAAPAFIGTHVPPAWPAALAVDGNRGYVVGADQLEILDLTAPLAPVSLGSIALGDDLLAVAASGDLAVVGAVGHDVIVVDVAVPSIPVELGRLAGGPAFDAAVAGTDALVAAGTRGLLVVDLVAPVAPSIRASFDSSGTAEGVVQVSPLVAVSAAAAQHFVLDCLDCVLSCRVRAGVQAPAPSICEGEEMTLDAGGTTADGCPSGVAFQWYEDGALLSGETSSTFLLASTHAAGTFDFTVEATCLDDVTCWDEATLTVDVVPDVAPAVDPASLRVRKVVPDPDHELSWTFTGAPGDVNVHFSLGDASVLSYPPDPATIATFGPGTTYVSSVAPPSGTVAFYVVHGRASCSGDSAP